MDYETLVSGLKFDEKGLIPVVVQDYVTHEVLTLAYMNRESLKITLEEKRTCFYSRSRQCLWRKGETSGNVQTLVSLTADCDGDALVAQVKKAGPACHTGSESCFFNGLYENEDIRPFSLSALMEVIAGRKTSPRRAATPPTSLRRAGTRSSRRSARNAPRCSSAAQRATGPKPPMSWATWSITPWC